MLKKKYPNLRQNWPQEKLSKLTSTKSRLKTAEKTVITIYLTDFTKGIISKYEYNNYTYESIKLNGVVKNKHFNGETEINDANIKLNFNGLAYLNQIICM